MFDRNEFDWKEVAKYCEGFDYNDIKEVVFSEEGENDGDEWVAVF